MTPPEREQWHEIDPEIVLAFTSVFVPRTDIYPLQLQNGRYIARRGTLYPDLVVAHLKGFITIGAYGLDSEDQAKWICFDADTEEQWQHLIRLSQELSDVDVSSYLETSRRGGHLWLFFSHIPGSQARRFGKQLLTEYDIPPLELYPKQDKLSTGTGSFVRLPLGKHQRTEKRYHFITTEGNPIAPSVRTQVALLAKPELVSPTFISSLVIRSPEPKVLSPTPSFSEKSKRKHKRILSGGRPSERIKQAISVFEFVGQYVELDRQGHGYCPFHSDEHKSFGVSQDGNYWHCFAGCGGGSIIDFWMRWRKKQGKDGSFKATITDLATILLK